MYSIMPYQGRRAAWLAPASVLAFSYVLPAVAGAPDDMATQAARPDTAARRGMPHPVATGPHTAARPGSVEQAPVLHPAGVTPVGERIDVTGTGAAPVTRRLALPQTDVGISQAAAEATINLIDSEDALKYLPSISLRKRTVGDTQATVQTRTWGVNSSARSLVYVDDALISALISNNNTNGAPRWGMVAPEQIERIDVLYGPFAAAYPGNSMGGVVQITTRMPDHFAATVRQTGAVQNFSSYRTRGNYGSSNTAVTLGDRWGRFSWLISGNREESLTQPLFFVTTSASPLGSIAALSKTGAVANVAGAGGLQHVTMNNATGRFAYDITDWLRATYTIGYWTDEAVAHAQAYLRTVSGAATFGGVSGFANDTYTLGAAHLSNMVTLRSSTHGHWDGEGVFTSYDYLNDWQRNPAGVLSGTNFTTGGYITRMTGTGWKTADGRLIWRPIRGQEVSFGAHWDRYMLDNPTWNAANWQDSPATGNGTLKALGRGATQTEAVWAQDAWHFLPGWTLTVGGRMEFWQASNGYNLAGTVGRAQPRVTDAHFSPKATLAWDIDPRWQAKLSFGEAWRFPTVSELYQIVATGPTYAVPNANLRPERVLSGEAVIERRTADSLVRLSLFQENTHDALISQMTLMNQIYVTTNQNVTEIRNRGVEFVLQKRNLFGSGLDLTNSVTYVDSRILADPGFASSSGTTATGKHVPYVPAWRDTLQLTWHATKRLDLTGALRYQGKMYSTLDNTDRIANVFGAFDAFLVADLHVHYDLTKTMTADIGVDNVNNAHYYLYHPFMMRTWSGSIKARF